MRSHLTKQKKRKNTNTHFLQFVLLSFACVFNSKDRDEKSILIK